MIILTENLEELAKNLHRIYNKFFEDYKKEWTSLSDSQRNTWVEFAKDFKKLQ